MKRSLFLFLVLASLNAVDGRAAERPRYGGTLRVETRGVLARIDPAQRPEDPAAARLQETLLALVCERLVRVDETGKPQPALATDWQQSADHKSWIFQLRQAVKFHDGSPLNAGAVVDALAIIQPGWRITATAPAPSGTKELSAIVISPDSTMPDLPIELAAPQYSIFRRTTQTNFVGTGPFRMANWQPGRSVTFTANDDYWAGRPFLDGVEFIMARAPHEQVLDLQLGQADVVEISPDQLRQLAVPGNARIRTWSTRPMDLLALVFERSASENERWRQALALSIDRATMRDVSLQKQGEPAGGLLPQWLSGYEFLFSTAADPQRARQLWSEAQAAPVKLAYDASGPLARTVAERIVVNARAAGISLQLARGQGEAGAVKVVLQRIDTIDPGRALLHLATALGLSSEVRWPENSEPAELYAAEQKLLSGNRVIPLVVLPESYALGPQVRNWMAVPLPEGDWRLENVWLERESR